MIKITTVSLSFIGSIDQNSGPSFADFIIKTQKRYDQNSHFMKLSTYSFDFHFHSSDFLRVSFVKLSALMCFMSEVSDSEVDELFMSFWPCYQVLNFYINLYNLYTRKSYTP